MHKFYIFTLVDKFGIFIPQAVISAIALGTCIYMSNMIKQLDEVEEKDWHVSIDVLLPQEDDQEIDGKSNASSNYDTVFNGIVDKIDGIPALFSNLPVVSNISMPTSETFQKLNKDNFFEIFNRIYGFFKTVGSLVTVLVLMAVYGTVDFVNKYFTHNFEGVGILLYTLVAIVLRNSQYSQEVQDWTTEHQPKALANRMFHFYSDKTTITMPVLNQKHFAIIVLVLCNKLNRHDRDIKVASEGKSKIVAWLRQNACSVFFDVMRCLFRDILITVVLDGASAYTTDSHALLSSLANDIMFIAAVSIFVNQFINVSLWKNHLGPVWCIIMIEYFTQLGASLLVVLNKADGEIVMWAGLLLIEILAPLASMLAEEKIIRGSVNTREFFKNHRDYLIAPVCAIATAYGLKQYYQTFAVSDSLGADRSYLIRLKQLNL